MTNSTFVANNAAGGGGAIDNAATATVAYSTFSEAPRAAAASSRRPRPVQDTVLRGTILATNAPGGNCAGTQIDQGFNIEDGATCGFSVPLSDPAPTRSSIRQG